jgi:hypothetical protein
MRAKAREYKNRDIDPATVLNAVVVVPETVVTFKDDFDAYYEKSYREMSDQWAGVWKASMTKHAASLMVMPTHMITCNDVLSRLIALRFAPTECAAAYLRHCAVRF